jgi:hypothetical protein
MATMIHDDGMRETDGQIDSADEFWQLVQDTGYLMEGESREFGINQLQQLQEAMSRWFANHPDIKYSDGDGAVTPLDHFAMLSVNRLVHDVLNHVVPPPPAIPSTR